MVAVASELGFAGGELEDLGIELEESRCSMGVCKLNFNDFNAKKLDKLLNQKPKLSAFEDKLKCHPFVKDSVMPKVEIIWNYFPFTFLCGECAIPFEFIFVNCNPLFLCFCWFYYPFMLLTAVPWNTFWASILMFLTVVSCGLFIPCW